MFGSGGATKVGYDVHTSLNGVEAFDFTFELVCSINSEASVDAFVNQDMIAEPVLCKASYLP